MTREPARVSGNRRFTSPAARRRAGRAMLTVAAIGVVVALAGGVAGWLLVGSVDRSTRESLAVTVDTLDSVEDTLELVDVVLDATTGSIDSAAATLDAVAASADTATGLVAGIDDLTGVVGPTLQDTAATLRQLEGLGGMIDDLLRGLSAVPFGPDYDPERDLAAVVGDLAADIEVLPEQFDRTSDQLDEFGDAIGILADELDRLSGDVRTVQDGLADSDQLVDAYARNVADARLVAARALDDLDGDIAVMRWVLVIGALNLAAGQIVPFWVGRELLERTRTGPDTALPDDARPGPGISHSSHRVD